MKTEWVRQNEIWGDPRGSEHVTLDLGLQSDGIVVWRKIKHAHPVECPHCGEYAKSKAGRHKICHECGYKLLNRTVVAGISHE